MPAAYAVGNRPMILHVLQLRSQTSCPCSRLSLLNCEVREGQLGEAVNAVVFAGSSLAKYVWYIRSMQSYAVPGAKARVIISSPATREDIATGSASEHLIKLTRAACMDIDRPVSLANLFGRQTLSVQKLRQCVFHATERDRVIQLSLSLHRGSPSHLLLTASTTLNV